MNSESPRPVPTTVEELVPPALIAEARRLEIRTRRSMNAETLGAYRSAFRGSGLTFADLRAYEPGDEVKNIHWKATARTGRVQVKTFEEERQLNILVAIDTSPSTVFGAEKKNLQKAIQFGALMALLARASGDAFGLCLFGETVSSFTAPGRRRTELQRSLVTLLGVKPTGGGTNIGAALHHINARQRRPAVIFVVSDFVAPPFGEELALLSVRHDVICVALRDTLDVAVPRAGLVMFKDPESERACIIDTSSRSVREALAFANEIRRESLRRECRRVGAALIEIDDDPLGPLQALMQQRLTRRR